MTTPAEPNYAIDERSEKLTRRDTGALLFAADAALKLAHAGADEQEQFYERCVAALRRHGINQPASLTGLAHEAGHAAQLTTDDQPLLSIRIPRAGEPPGLKTGAGPGADHIGDADALLRALCAAVGDVTEEGDDALGVDTSWHDNEAGERIRRTRRVVALPKPGRGTREPGTGDLALLATLHERVCIGLAPDDRERRVRELTRITGPGIARAGKDVSRAETLGCRVFDPDAAMPTLAPYWRAWRFRTSHFADAVSRAILHIGGNNPWPPPNDGAIAAIRPDTTDAHYWELVEDMAASLRLGA